MTDTATRFTIRQLPLPAKLVVTCFLLAVGGGYLAAMIQLHIQDSKSGKPMPDLHDVVLKYTGKKWFTEEPPAPQSTLVCLITADEHLPFSGTGTMAPAFFTKDPTFTRGSRGGQQEAQALRAQREGERAAVVLWAKSDPATRQTAFETDRFVSQEMPAVLTPQFQVGKAVRVRSILEARCTRCHKPNGDDNKAANYPLITYADFEKYLTVTERPPFRSGGDWVRVQEPISLEKLTQSTHAHLLSFAVLFGLTGLVFAFTSYPGVVRGLLGPLVLVALVSDISLWWLARQCSEWGPYFAMAIMGTGAAAGTGLVVQITLSLFNMYGPKGKLVLIGLFALGGAGAGLVYLNQIKPALDAKQQKPETPTATPKADETGKAADPSGPKTDNGTMAPEKVQEIERRLADLEQRLAGIEGKLSGTKETRFEQMLRFPVQGEDGKDIPVLNLTFKKDQPGGMVRAFFDKDSDEFAKAVKDKDTNKQAKLTPARHGERLALLAWSKLPEPKRREAYQNGFTLPPDLAGKPITDSYVKAGKVQIEALVTDRCIRCHADEAKAPFSDYDGLLKYFK